MEAYGPVPSRRLGQSLGINHIPPKVCSYSCVYCQLGDTINVQVERRKFYEPEEVARKIEAKVENARSKGEDIDYLSFVPDGEPTLDMNLGEEIELIRPLEMDIAVITNASLIWCEDVREDLSKADWVSLKVDAVDKDTWREVNRPHDSLEIEKILEGIRTFAGDFEGTLATETMLIDGVNDSDKNIREVFDFLSELDPDEAYISIPTRPPAKEWAGPASEQIINRAYQIFSEDLRKVEHLIGYEGSTFAFTGDVEEDLLNITAVHPMREEGVRELLRKADSNWDLVERLIERGELIEAEYQENKYYMRKLPGRSD